MRIKNLISLLIKKWVCLFFTLLKMFFKLVWSLKIGLMFFLMNILAKKKLSKKLGTGNPPILFHVHGW